MGKDSTFEARLLDLMSDLLAEADRTLGILSTKRARQIVKKHRSSRATLRVAESVLADEGLLVRAWWRVSTEDRQGRQRDKTVLGYRLTEKALEVLSEYRDLRRGGSGFRDDEGLQRALRAEREKIKWNCRPAVLAHARVLARRALDNYNPDL